MDNKEMEDGTTKQKFLDDLKVFCNLCKTITDDVCKSLSWDEETLLSEATDLTVCPVDESHRVPRQTLDKHANLCRLKKAGLTQEDIEELVPSSQFYYEKATNVYSTVIDKQTQNSVLREHTSGVFRETEVPVTNQHATVELSPAQRLALHQFVINSAKKDGKSVTELSDELLFADLSLKKDQGGDQPMSRAEAMAAQRDMKRRRQTYRAKNVHVTKKSYTEVIREVIQNQTEMLRVSAEGKMSEESVIDQDNQSSHSLRSKSSRKSRSPKRSRSDRRSRSRSSRRSRSRKRSKSRHRSRSPSSTSDKARGDSHEHHKSRKSKHRSKHKKHSKDS